MNETSITELLGNDNKVKVASVDDDGVLRGKVMSKDKFLCVAASGFGMSSALFAWDMHDEICREETSISSKGTSYGDLLAIPDLNFFSPHSLGE